MAKPDPCGIRYGLWRARALAMVATEDVYAALVRRALDEAGIHVGCQDSYVVGTLHPALDQMVVEGLLERIADEHQPRQPRLLRITPKGRELLGDLRGDVASVLDLIDRSLGRRRRSHGAQRRATDPHAYSNGAVAQLLAVARDIQQSTARLRRALDQAKAIVEDALAQVLVRSNGA